MLTNRREKCQAFSRPNRHPQHRPRAQAPFESMHRSTRRSQWPAAAQQMLHKQEHRLCRQRVCQRHSTGILARQIGHGAQVQSLPSRTALGPRHWTALMGVPPLSPQGRLSTTGAYRRRPAVQECKKGVYRPRDNWAMGGGFRDTHRAVYGLGGRAVVFAFTACKVARRS